MTPHLLEVDYQPRAVTLGNGVAGHFRTLKTCGNLAHNYKDSLGRETRYNLQRVIVRGVIFSVFVAEQTLQEVVDNIIEFAGDRVLKLSFEECFNDATQNQVLEFLGQEGSRVVRKPVQDSQG